MPKALSISGMVVAICLVLIFGLDLAVGFPFGRPEGGMTTDIGFVVSALVLGYLSWATYREQQ